MSNKPSIFAPEYNWADFVKSAIPEAEKAMRKYPQPNYVITKVAEEAGEVVKAAIHCAEGRETPQNVRDEMRQLIAMLYRLWIEGDQIHGLPPMDYAVAYSQTPDPVTNADSRQQVTLKYTNWRGETADRTIIPRKIWFGSTEWHAEPQWLLTATDVEKDADRDFALKDFGQPTRTYEDGVRDAQAMAISAIEDQFPGALYASNRTKCISLIKEKSHE